MCAFEAWGEACCARPAEQLEETGRRVVVWARDPRRERREGWGVKHGQAEVRWMRAEMVEQQRGMPVTNDSKSRSDLSGKRDLPMCCSGRDRS